LLRQRAAAAPQLQAVEIWDGELGLSLTYQQLADAAAAGATWLSANGISDGDRVMIVSDTCLDLIVALYACAWARAIAVPINTGWVVSEVADVAARIAPSLVLADSEDRLADLRAGLPTGTAVKLLAGVADGDVARSEPAPRAAPTTPFELIFTSGTTAQPKGVTLSHHNCLGGAVQAGATMGWGRGGRFGSALPLFHVNAQTFCLWSALVWEGTAIFFKKFSASDFPRQLDAAAVTATSLVSVQVRTMVRQQSHLAHRPGALQHIVFAINVSDEERDEIEHAWGVQLRNGYGLSEAMTLVALEPAWLGRRLWPSVGLPAVGRRIRVVDPDSGLDAEPGAVGELLIAGEPGLDLMLGYWDDPAATADAIENGWLHTGDLVRLGDVGEVYYVARIKDVIKVAGENVSAAEVEEAIASHPAVLECAVVSLPDPIRDERIAAAIVTTSEIDRDELDAHLAERLSPFKRPVVVWMIDSLPRTNIGKVDKAAIRIALQAEDGAST
jgi:crotonobetaine/carnitine-CoA ligase